MNIVLLPSPPFEEIGGVSTHVYMLAKGLRELGHDVFVIQGNSPGWFRIPIIRIPELMIEQVSLYFARRYRRWSEDLYYVLNALWKTKLEIDVLNVQNVQHTGISKILRYMTKCKTVLTVHGYLTYEAEDRKWCTVGDKTHQWLWSLEKVGYGQFDSIVCVGRAVEKHIKQFTAKPITRIPNGLDTEYFRPNRVLALQHEGGNIVFAGMLQESKGIMDALETIRILVKDYKRDAVLKIAGTGPQEPLARQFVANNGLEAHVTFLGSLSKEKMPDFYRGGDVFLSTSKVRGILGKGEEPFPYTILEAMACGVPIVAYRTGGLPEQVRDGLNGFLVEPGNVEDLANRVKELLDNRELLEKMGTAARNHCVQNFSHIYMAQKFLAAYRHGEEMQNTSRN